ncbi:carbohydrate ABC transporter permease [Paenibacillus sp. WLX1005]|uniref:carbohydrate ABC transporter permease n=1 Tax=Paenibacillus sp. WLX1005 TaxID=3243766 RepID=UPI003983E75F
MNKNYKVQTLLLLVCHVVLAAIILLPLAFALASSFRRLEDVFKYMSPISWKTFVPMEPTWQAYANLFVERGFGRVVFNTFFTSIVEMIGALLIGSLAAFAFAFYNFRCKHALFVLVLVAFMIPFEVTAIPLYRLVDALGMIDSYSGIIVPGLANALVVFLYRQFFLDLPPALFEAARIDGAGTLRMYAQIIMPLCRPVTVSAALMVFVHQWESFMWPLIAVRSRQYAVIQVALNDFTTEMGTYWNELFAAVIISMIVPILLLVPLQRYFVKSVSSSGIKG